VSAFIDEHCECFGVEPICRVLGVSASAYDQRAKGELSARRREDERLLEGRRIEDDPSGRGGRRRYPGTLPFGRCLTRPATDSTAASVATNISPRSGP
jgi:hypothetical protein